MLNQEPIQVKIPEWGVVFVESRHHPQFRMVERVDPFHKFILVNEGRMSLHFGETRNFRLDPHTVCFVPAGSGHRLEDHSPTSLLILCISVEFPHILKTLLPAWDRLSTLLQEPVLPSGLLTQRIETQWRRGIGEQDKGTELTPLNLQILAMEIMVSLVRAARFPRKRDPRQRITQLNELLEAEYYEPWDVEKAAKTVQLSRRRFSDYFKEITGQSFVERLTHIRIEKAKALMRIGEYSIAGAGFSSGFNDLSHFYRTFKKVVGFTPGEWLRRQ